jgi:hypothetical protein
MITLVIADINDSTFKRMKDDATRNLYVSSGLSRAESLCLQYGIDNTKIPEPNAYVPKEIAETCALIAMCEDNLGSDWREVTAGVSIDVYKQKLDVLKEKLSALLQVFTPTMCGYEDTSKVGTSSASISIARA